MNSSGGFNHGMGSDQANNHHGTYNNQSLQNDGQNNSIESSTQQQQQSTQHNFGMMDNNNMDMNHDQMIANEVDQQATTTTNDSYPSINPSPSHLRDANILASLAAVAAPPPAVNNNNMNTQNLAYSSTSTLPPQHNNSAHTEEDIKLQNLTTSQQAHTDSYKRYTDQSTNANDNGSLDHEKQLAAEQESKKQAKEAFPSLPDGGDKSKVDGKSDHHQDDSKQKVAAKDSGDNGVITTTNEEVAPDSPVINPFSGVDKEESNLVDFGHWKLAAEEEPVAEKESSDEAEFGEEDMEVKKKAAVASIPTEAAGQVNPTLTTNDSILPPPTKIPETGTVTLRGKLTVSDGVHKISGVWALGLDNLANGLEFEYQHQVTEGQTTSTPPLDGKYPGYFSALGDEGKVKIAETDVELMFTKNNEGYYNIEGAGSNLYGSYYIYGTFTSDGVITMCRKFEEDKQKPVRTKRVASRKPRSSGKKRGRKSSTGTPSKKKKIKTKEEDKHSCAGKRYGLGEPGLLCDCCFFEEEADIGDTPFIKCLSCGLTTHVACYPPTSNIYKNGNFLCDVCTAVFHPSINKDERMKNATGVKKVEPPKQLSEENKAKSDGRIHDTTFCQLCHRYDVLGGMKPTDTNGWVHLACLMSTEDAYFDEKVAVNVQGELKKNRSLCLKYTKGSVKPKCEECSGESGMLLKCKEEGCTKFTHALCAEILDRRRVITNNGSRDIIGYMCELHSYVGQLDTCGVCKLGDRQNEMLECDKCKQGYHLDCLTPPLTESEIPDGDWFCSKCSVVSESQDDNVLPPPPEAESIPFLCLG